MTNYKVTGIDNNGFAEITLNPESKNVVKYSHDCLDGHGCKQTVQYYTNDQPIARKSFGLDMSKLAEARAWADTMRRG